MQSFISMRQILTSEIPLAGLKDMIFLKNIFHIAFQKDNTNSLFHQLYMKTYENILLLARPSVVDVTSF